MLHHIFDGRSAPVANKQLRIITQLAYVYPVGHERYLETLDSMARIRHLCGFPQGDDRLAGYVEFAQCEGGDDADAEVLELLAGAASPS